MSDGRSSRVRFNRAMLYVADLEVSIRFYEALGLRLAGRDDEVARMASATGTLVLHVTEQADQIVTAGARVYLEADDPSAVVQAALAADGELVDGVRLREWGWRHGYIRDPDGWEISIYARGQHGDELRDRV